MRILKAAWLALEEALSRPVLERTPEPTPGMDETENVQAFHDQGSDQGSLLPVYHFNATNIHRLTPRNGTVVDLGCGSGRCLAHLARCRPDLNLIGVDLSSEMVAVGNDMLRKTNLFPRVQLCVGNMADFCDLLPLRVDTISSVFALHHLPNLALLSQCFDEIGRGRKERGFAVWVFDHARPNSRKTAERFPKIFTPKASGTFQQDSFNSLIASWRYEELRELAANKISGGLKGSLARLLPLYQIHWAQRSGVKENEEPGHWQTLDLRSTTQRDANQLASLFASLP